MSQVVSLALLGAFEAQCDGEPVTRFEYDKVRALLAYLAVEANRPQRRDTLIELFWPEQGERAARHNLSQALMTLRQALGERAATPPLLLIDRVTIRLNPAVSWQIDMAEFEAHLAACTRHSHAQAELCASCMQWRHQALVLYRGDFLKGLAIGDSAGFEEWVARIRERLHGLALDALFALARYHEWRGEYPLAQTYARRQLELEPWREEAHQQLIRLLAYSGQRGAALAQYEACRQVLDAEFGVEPAAATRELYNRLRATAAATSPLLPAVATALIGRQEEVAAVASMLAHPDCRLLTISGPGGVGKTRLALQVARLVSQRFIDGVYYLPLASLEAAALLVTALAQALEFSFYGTGDQQAQLLDYLRQRELLLVLDNAEHLPDAASFIATLLAQAANLKLIITSRARLHLSWEWVFELGGLAVPAEPSPAALEAASAAQLFTYHARRVYHPFVLLAAEHGALARICQLVDGLPLALELAASWVRSTSCAEIASEIERGLDVLNTAAPELPVRHRSMRAVFDHSWQLLAPDERQVLRSLSVFRGGFSRAAASQVVGASLAALTRLVDTSLVHYQASGRYDMHELLRQYAVEQARTHPIEYRQVRERHRSYYATLLYEHATRLQGGAQQPALAEIEQELANIRAAWQAMLESSDLPGIARALEGLFLFYDLRGWAKEGETMFGVAARQLGAAMPTGENELLLARLWVRQARFASQLSDYSGAHQQVQQSIPQFERHKAQAELAFALNLRGEIASHTGDYALARTTLAESLAIYRVLDQQRGIATVLANLGSAIHNQGEYQAARQHYADSLALFRALHDDWGAASALHKLGLVAYELGKYQEAEAHYRASLAIKRTLDDRWGIANSLNNLGIVFFDLGDYATAERHYRESLAIRQELGNRWGVAAALNNLGLIAATRAAYTEAQAWYQQSLALCHTIGDQRGVAIALNNLGEVAAAGGDYQAAQAYHQQSLARFRQIGQARGTTFALGFLGDVCLALGQHPDAQTYYSQALALAIETQAAPRALDALVGLAALLAQDAAYEQATELLALVLGHPASETPTLAKARHHLASLTAQLPAPVLAQARERGATYELTTVAQALLGRFPN